VEPNPPLEKVEPNSTTFVSISFLFRFYFVSISFLFLLKGLAPPLPKVDLALRSAYDLFSQVMKGG
jgi:hypothetical protein